MEKNNHLTIGHPLGLTDVSFLENEFKAQNIPCIIKPDPAEVDDSKEGYTIYVDGEYLEQAKELFIKHFGGGKDPTSVKNNALRLDQRKKMKALAAGVLGAMTGLRVGVKVKGMILFPVFMAIILGVIAYLSVYHLSSRK